MSAFYADVYLEENFFNFLKKRGYDPGKFIDEKIYPYAEKLFEEKLLDYQIKREKKKITITIIPTLRDFELLLKRIEDVIKEIKDLTRYIW